MCSYLCSLDFQTEPPFDCVDEDSRDVAFVKATNFIGGRDAMEEYLASKMYPLCASVSFKRVTHGVTPVSRLELPLPKFRTARKDDVQFFVRVE
jgi:hypothetical protein